jgi:hypothetical protein
VKTCLKETRPRLAALAIAVAIAVPLCAAQTAATQVAPAQAATTETGPPPSSGGFFPLSQVHRGLTGTAWTVFEGTRPESMQVEILGVLRGVLGPRKDLILARLHGTKPEYTGVVEGMSGSPVYIGNKLLGALSYRIGQFSKEPIAGITPIEQMLEVRNLPIGDVQMAALNPASADATPRDASPPSADGMNFQMIETPLVMSGFSPQAVEFWQKQMSGTGLAPVAAGGVGGSSAPDPRSGPQSDPQPSSAAAATLEPGSAISALLVRGDLEISGTCTVTYIDAKQLLACGHPILQAGTVSLPMTTADVVATLASPLNAFKIINTEATVGAFTEDRDSAIRGVLGAKAHMIPVRIALTGPDDLTGPDKLTGPDDHRTLNVEILDLPALTPQAVTVVLYQSLLQSNEATATMSYHLTGSIDLDGFPAVPIDLWSTPGEMAPAPLELALLVGQQFNALYTNGARQGAVRSIDLHVEEIPRRIGVELKSARLVSNDIVHAGDTVEVEATIQPWQQPARNVRIPVRLPSRLDSGSLRLLVSDGATLDRTLHQPQSPARPVNLSTLLEEARNQHAADRIYVSLLVPEAQAGVDGQTLSSVPLSMANALEPVRVEKDIALNGESAEPAAEAPAGGVLTGFQILNLHIEPGGGLN